MQSEWLTSLTASTAKNIRRKKLEAKRRNYIKQPPHPKQRYALNAFKGVTKPTEILFGGAAGGGKSTWLLQSALEYVDTPGYNALLLRRTYAELALPGGLMFRSHEWLDDTDAKWNEQKKTWSFPSGATLSFGYIHRPIHVTRYLSTEYQYVGWEELTTFPKRPYLYLFSRLRKNKSLRLADGSPMPLRFRAATNPGGIGHEWVKARFIRQEREGDEPIDNVTRRLFIPSFVRDNPSLDEAEYATSLGYLDETTKAQLLRGDWDASDDGLVSVKEIMDVEIEHCLWEDGGVSSRNPELYLGIDVARTGDLFAMATLELLNGVFWLRELVVEHRARYSEMKALIRERLKRKAYVRCCIDQGSIGHQMAEEMADEFGEDRVEGVSLSIGRQGQLASVLRTDIVGHTIHLPRSDVLRADFRLVRKVGTGIGGTPILEVDRAFLEDQQRSHADRFWGVALARHAAGVVLPKRTYTFAAAGLESGL
jgi:hypothetical protein